MSVSNESTAAPGVVIALARWLYGFHCISSLTSEVIATIQIEKEPGGMGFATNGDAIFSGQYR
jgi:hypothetical protein